MLTEKLKKISVIIGVVMLAMFAVGVSELNVSADNGEYVIELVCAKDDIILKGMKWDLYKVGERQDDNYVLTGDFEGYPAELSDTSAEKMSQAAKTLESVAVTQQFSVLTSGVAGNDGKIVFQNLEAGLYLASGKKINIGPKTYIPSAVLLEVSEENKDAVYNVYPKTVAITFDAEMARYIVKKVWVGDEAGSIARPTYVTVDLYKGTELKDTVVLNEKNNWQHIWDDLDVSADEWYVIERDIPVNYEVSIDCNMYQYLIKNNYKAGTDVEFTTAVSATATSAETNTTTADYTIGEINTKNTTVPAVTSVTASEITGTQTITSFNTVESSDGKSVTTINKTVTETKNSAVNTTTGNKKLPQTGQLWWPVPVLGAGGLLFIAAGARIRKKDDK